MESGKQQNSTKREYAKVNVGTALKLRMKGLSYTAIGKQLGCHRTAVHKAISPLLASIPGSEHLQEYKANMEDYLTAKSFEAFSAISTDKLQNAGARDLAIIGATLIDKARLVGGHSTSNNALTILLGSVSNAESQHSQASDKRVIDAELIT